MMKKPADAPVGERADHATNSKENTELPGFKDQARGFVGRANYPIAAKVPRSSRNPALHKHDAPSDGGPAFGDQFHSASPAAASPAAAASEVPLVSAVPVDQTIEAQGIIDSVDSSPSTDSLERQDQTSPIAMRALKRRHVYIMLAVLVAGAIAVGSVCGAGKCGGGSVETQEHSMTDRVAAIKGFVNNITLQETAIEYPVATSVATPEELALKWLIEDDPLELTVDTAIDRFRLKQRYALLTIWFQSDDEPWVNDAGWVTVTDECKWYGITCIPADLGGGIGLQNVVSRINLGDKNNLHGRIPADIAFLTFLTFLNFDENSLTGSLPSSVWTLHKLEHLEVDNNFLSGTLPDTIGDLTNLDYFDINDSSFSGTLPNSVGRWSNLKEIYLDNNRFTGTIPDSISNWTRIRIARFNRNEFSGSVPDDICDASSLSALWADCVSEVACSCCTQCN